MFNKLENLELNFERFYRGNWFELVFRVPDVCEEPFECLDFIRRLPAVYLQLRENGQVYVGKTNNLYKRTVNHRSAGVKIKVLVARYVPDCSEEELDQFETEMIARAMNYGFDLANDEKLIAAHKITLGNDERARKLKILEEISEPFLNQWALEHYGFFSRQARIESWLNSLNDVDACFFRNLSIKSQLFLMRYFECFPKAWKLYGDVWSMSVFAQRLLVVSGKRCLLDMSTGITMTLSKSVTLLALGSLDQFLYARLRIEENDGMVFVIGRLTEIDRLLDEEWVRLAVTQAYLESMSE